VATAFAVNCVLSPQGALRRAASSAQAALRRADIWMNMRAFARAGVAVLLETLTHRLGVGWLAPLPSHLDSADTLVLAFGASEYAQHPLPLTELATAFPRSVLVGCSTAGEIAGAQVSDASLSVAVAQFAHTRLRRALTEVAGPADSRAAGERLGAQLAGEGLRAVFVLSDGLNVNGTPLVEGLAGALPPGVAISGGLASDGDRFASTWVLDGARPAPRCISAVGLYGTRLHVGHGYEGGWSDFGPERHITRSEGNILYELDGKPALDLYKTYLGKLAAGLPGTALLFPLAIRRHDGSDALVRTILGIDEAQQSLTFAGDMPEGAIARLMRTNSDRLIDSASQAVQQATHDLSADAAPLVIAISCVGRRLILGQRTEEEVETVVDGAPPRARHVGFYSYGEISPAHGRDAVSELHNQTMTVTVLSED
jgi:hypothetical protein